MELDLDNIAEDKIDNVKVLREFYDKFVPLVDHAYQNMEKKELEKEKKLQQAILAIQKKHGKNICTGK